MFQNYKPSSRSSILYNIHSTLLNLYESPSKTEHSSELDEIAS